MRFKKLKISIAVALIVFVLVAGNIIAFGLLQNNGPQKTPIDLQVLQTSDPKKTANQTTAVVSSPKTTDTTSVQTQNTNAPVTPQPQVVVTNIRTRAS